MGRKIRFLYYYIKRIVFLLLLIWLGLKAAGMLGILDDSELQSRAATVILPQVTEVDAAGVNQFLHQPNITTLIFFYRSSGVLSRWYFGNLNAMAAIYAPQGVRLLFVSLDGDINDFAKYLAAQDQINFPILHMAPAEADKLPGVLHALGADQYDSVPYMGIMNAAGYIRDFSPAIVRTGKIREVLDAALRGL